MTVAALYVDPKGPYAGLEGVECWDEARDARLYAGPWPVVAHPPCERWGSYWYGGPLLHAQGRRRRRGDDGGCFAAALAAVRTWGGVLEHPAHSSAWWTFGLADPPTSGGWVPADWLDGHAGWTCHVEQGHYGHRARKATWLYACHAVLPELIWGPSPAGARLDDGFHSAAERAAAKAQGRGPLERLSHRERRLTPVPFRDLLLSIARSAEVGRIVEALA